MSNPATQDRHFIIAREGMSIIVREVRGGSDVTFDRTDAWNLARRMAKPAKAAKDSRAKAPNSIEFIGLNDSMRTVVQTAQQTQDAYEAELRGEQPAPAVKAPQATPAPVADKNTELAYAWLRNEKAMGKLNEFMTSLSDQLDSKGKLSEKQIACVEKAMTPAKREQPKVDVPEGHYAVDGEDGTLKFYKLDKPTEGRWEGYTFLKVQAGDDFFPVKGAAKHTIIAKIATDVRGALVRYGHELGKCGVCNRTLTDEASREAGIGPVCAANGGF